METRDNNYHGLSVFPNAYHYSMLFFSFFLPISRASISLSFFWYVMLFIAGRNYKVSLKAMWEYPALRWMSAFFLFTWLTYLWSTDTVEAWNIMRLYGYWLVIPILAVNLNKVYLNQYINAFLLGMLVSVLLSYGAYFGIWNFRGMTPDYPVPFMYHIHYSVFLATMAVILLVRIASRTCPVVRRIVMGVFLVSITGALIISVGRTGQVALIVSIVAFVLIRNRNAIKPVVFMIILLSSLLVVLYKTIEPFQQRIDVGFSDIKELRDGNYNTSLGIRAAFWIAAVNILKEYPVLGVGAGDYHIAATEFINNGQHYFNNEVADWLISSHFHNQYLMVSVQSGFVGLILMALMMLSLLRIRIPDMDMKTLSVLSLVIYFVAFMAEPLWFVQFPIGLFIFIVSISLVASEKRGGSIT